jgi:GTP-binding protein EngB required for normal cell division
MLPWLQSNFNFPLSGNVNQKIEPDWFSNTINADVGDSEIEREIFQKVASYGKQIGMVTEVLISIADKLKIDSNANAIQSLAELKKLQTRIESIKISKKNRIKEKSKTILDKLRVCDPEGFKKLMEEYANSR